MSTETPEELSDKLDRKVVTPSSVGGGSYRSSSLNPSTSTFQIANAPITNGGAQVSESAPVVQKVGAPLPAAVATESLPDRNSSPPKYPPSNIRQSNSGFRAKYLIYSAIGVIALAAIAAGILITSYPNVLIKYVVKPKLQSWVREKFGNGYTFAMDDITLSPKKDSLIITGVRLAENEKMITGKGSSDDQTWEPNAIEGFIVDTIRIAGFDYWKLLAQNGLYASSVTVRSPRIYLRPGALPRFAANTAMFPSFMPLVSSKVITIDNAQLFYADASTEGTATESRPANSEPTASGVLIAHASIELRDFYVDAPTYKKGTRTFFSKSAQFHAEEISHLDASGSANMKAATVNGNLIDSTLRIIGTQIEEPLSQIRRVVVDDIALTGLDWNRLLAMKGLSALSLTISTPQIYVQNGADPGPMKATTLVPMPSAVPELKVQTLALTDGEVYNLFPKSRDINAVKHLSLVLHDLSLKATTPLTNVSKFFSRSANFNVKGVTTLSTANGSIQLTDISGTEKSLQASNIRVHPILKGLRQVNLRSASVNGISWSNLLMRKGFFSGSIVLRQPDIYLDPSPATSKSDLTKSGPDTNPFAALQRLTTFPLPDVMPVIASGTITVTDGRLHGLNLFEAPADPPGLGDSVSGLMLSLKNFKLDRAAFLAKRGMLFSSAGTFSVGEVTHSETGSLYSFTEGGVSGNLLSHMLRIDSLVVHPLVTEESFGSLYQYRKNRYDAFVPQVVLTGFDYQKLLTGYGIFADSVLVENFRFDVFADKRHDRAPHVVPEVFPHEAFQHIPALVGIKSVILRDGEVDFRERWPAGSEPGKISMDNINATIGPISNDPSTTTQTTPTTIVGDMTVMGAGFFNYRIDYELLNPKLAIEVKARLDSMNVSMFNDYLIHAEPFKLTGGLIQSAEFQLSVKDSLMHGLLLPLYDNLRVEFFRYDGFPPGLFSLLANYIYMRSHNTLEKDHPPKSAEISAVISRDQNFFWSLWLPVRSAVSSVVGIPLWVW